MAPQLMATNGCLRARAEVVQRLRQRLLAGAAFAQQQDRNIGGGELLDVAADLQHRLAGR